MTTLLFTHSSSAEHDTGPGHPERADRIRAVHQTLSADRFDGLVRREAPEADRDMLVRVHDAGYVDALLEAVPEEGFVRIDADTVMSPASGEAAQRAAGAICAAIDGVVAGDAHNAFCAVRPPGHHAEPMRGMGFCLFNSVAIGAAHARAAHGLQRVAVIDFDVHHGNGTQAAFQADPDFFFASTHEYPLYPGTGAATERGVGNIVNVPLSPQSGSDAFRSGFTDAIVPALRAFAPDMILVSAGFDAHANDPLATLRFGEDDYHWVTAQLCDLAGDLCDGRLVSTLEGGYDLKALSDSVSAHVEALQEAI